MIKSILRQVSFAILILLLGVPEDFLARCSQCWIWLGNTHSHSTELCKVSRVSNDVQWIMVREHHRLNGHEFEKTLRESGEQRSLVCYSPRGCKQLDMSWWLNNTVCELQNSPLIFWPSSLWSAVKITGQFWVLSSSINNSVRKILTTYCMSGPVTFVAG